MNKPLLAPLFRHCVLRMGLPGLLLLFSGLGSLRAQPCGNPSPLGGVGTLACEGETDTLTINPYNLLSTYYLGVTPVVVGGVTVTSLIPGYPGYIIDYGSVPGNYQLIFSIGNPATCTDIFDVHVSGSFAPPTYCNDTINLSLDEQCNGEVLVGHILEGTYDSLDYVVVLKDPVTGNVIPTSPFVNGTHLGKYLIVEVHHVCSGTYCWGYVLVEDKLPPLLVCDTFIVACDADYAPEDIGFPMPPGAPDPSWVSGHTYTSNSSLVDNCGSTTIAYTDRIVHVDCPPPVPYIDTVFRHWTATDTYGNIFECTDTILIQVGDIGGVLCPPNFDNIQMPALYCGDNWPKDSLGNPHPDTTGYPTFSRCRNINVTYIDIRLNVCPGSYKILREWIVVDWCTGRQTSCIQVIKVLDDRGPILTCGPDQHISTLPNSCEGESVFKVPTVVKDCSAVSWEVWVKRAADTSLPPSAIDASQTGIIKLTDTTYKVLHLPVGTSWVLFIGRDQCGNVDTCASEAYVHELTRPVAVCDLETVVTLTDEGTAKVYAITFDDGSHDNCEMGGFKVRRMFPGDCPDPVKDDSLFGDYVEFCCSDIPNNPLTVVLQVTDKAGNTNECMVEVTIQDKKPPVVMCLPNIVISCEFDYSDLSVFGSYETRSEDIDPILIYDPTNNTLAQPHLWGYDQLVIEDCNLHHLSAVSYVFDNCGKGTITRRDTFFDDFNPYKVCKQTITVKDFTLFNGLTSIVWPRDTVITNGCHPSISPDVTGKPSWPSNTTCSGIVATYEDKVFNVVENVCFKVLRTWTVVDWCIFNSTTGAGRWSRTQVIKINNSIKPTILTPCSNLSFDGISDDCNGFATLTLEATDDCLPAQLLYSWEIDLGDNGSVEFYGTGNNASGTYPVGTHRIRWTVSDQCGNTSPCSYLFTIVDRKKPTPFCNTGLITVIMPSTGQVTIWAKDFNAGSKDNCTASDKLRFAFSSNPSNTTRTYTCPQIIGGVVDTFDVSIYVFDDNINSDYCDTKVIIQDGIGNACLDNLGGGTTGNLKGSVYNESYSKVENAQVLLDAKMPGMPKVNITGADGNYAFVGLPLNESYTISAQKDDDPMNGISTLDIVLIQRHILGLQVLESPYKVIAADVNNSQTITAKDVSDLRRMILGLTQQLPAGKSWKFISSNQKFANPLHPWPFEEQGQIDKMGGELVEQDFIAVKLGDVNGNARTNNVQGSAQRSKANFELHVDDLEVRAGGQTRIPVYAGHETDFSGMQLAFSFNTKSLKFSQVTSGLVDISDANYVIDQQAEVIRLSCDQNLVLTPGKPLFYLEFEALGSVRLSNALVLANGFASEMYDADLESREIDFRFRTGNSLVNGFFLYQNQPNPFDQGTSIYFNLPEAGDAVLSVYDLDGRKIYSQRVAGLAGLNHIALSREDLKGTGILYYQLEMNENKAMRKMLLME